MEAGDQSEQFVGSKLTVRIRVDNKGVQIALDQILTRYGIRVYNLRDQAK